MTPSTKLQRKRLRNVPNWKDVKSKKELNLGLEHNNRSGKNKSAKTMGLPCKCKMKCFDKISENMRKTVFDEYWGLGDHVRQWDFIARCVRIKEKKVATTSSNSRRALSREYYIPINFVEIKVCKVMFLNTISVSDKIISTVSKKLNRSPVIEHDMRGKHTNRPHVISTTVIDCIKEHIAMFPTVESHYRRATSQKNYLEADLSIAKMHRLYLDWVKDKTLCVKAQNATVRQNTDIFNTFNLSFFKPKKDLCDKCEEFKLASEEEKLKLQPSHDEHLTNKNIARDNKTADKKRAANDPDLCVAVFDLEKVLTTPQGEASNFYYKRKFTILRYMILLTKLVTVICGTNVKEKEVPMKLELAC